MEHCCSCDPRDCSPATPMAFCAPCEDADALTLD